MPLDIQGILQNISLGTEQVTVLYPYLREVFINETPLVTRTPREPAEGVAYNIITYDVRPRAYTLASAVLTTDTTINFVDASPLQAGDVFEMLDTAGTSAERVETLSVSANAVTVRRHVEGTSALANTAGGSAASLVITLQGNSRTGAEVDQTGVRSVRSLIPQQVQTFQYPVEVGGLANAVANTRLPAGISDVFSLQQKTKMTEMMRDMEYTSYYGLGEKPAAAGDRAKQAGLRTLIGYYNGRGAAPAAGSNVNVKTGAGGSYTFLNFVRDGIQPAIDGGGDPDTVLCATDFLTGLQTWGFAKQQINTPRMSLMGLPINEIAVPFASKVITFVPSYQMKKGSAAVLTSADVKGRYVRNEFWQVRGIRGDAKQGDYLADYCIETGHPGWHSWVEGITSYA